ncbi:unnamed protein product [Aphanomyces euteiches]
MHVNNWRDGDYAQFTVVKKPVVLEIMLNEATQTLTLGSSQRTLMLGSMFAGFCLTLVAVYAYNYRKHEARGFQRIL